MSVLAGIAVGLVALLHAGFFVLEAFLWDKPLGLRVFRLTPDFAKATRALAANQGVYNAFLAAGLAWGLALGTAGDPIKIFFLLCVIVAGVVGAATVNKRIFWVQGLPAVIALALVLMK